MARLQSFSPVQRGYTGGWTRTLRDVSDTNPYGTGRIIGGRKYGPSTGYTLRPKVYTSSNANTRWVYHGGKTVLSQRWIGAAAYGLWQYREAIMENLLSRFPYVGALYNITSLPEYYRWYQELQKQWASSPNQYAGYARSYWCESRNLSCLGGNPLAVEYRRTAAVAPPGTCPSVCTNTGTRHATFALASANGTAAQVRRTTMQLTGSVYAQFEKIATGTGYPMPYPVYLPNPWTDPAIQPMPRVKPNPNRAPNPNPRVSPEGRLNVRPSVMPALNIRFEGGRPAAVSRGTHISKPDKEPTRKSGPLGAASSGMRARFLRALQLMRGLTELKDAVNALFEGLPNWLQREMERKHGGDWIGHLLGIVDSADYYASNPATFTRAVENLLWEGIEDRTIGNLLGSSWRNGIRDWDKYGSTAWTDASFGGAFENDFGGPPEVHRNY